MVHVLTNVFSNVYFKTKFYSLEVIIFRRTCRRCEIQCVGWFLEGLKKYVWMAYYWVALIFMNLEFLQISLLSSSLTKNERLIPSSDGISWIISPIVSQRWLWLLYILTLSPILKLGFEVFFERRTFVCLSCLAFNILFLSSFVSGRFCEPGIGIFGVRPRYLWLGVPSIGLDAGVLFRKNIILCKACPLSLGFFFIIFLKDCTQASPSPFDSLFFGLEWFIIDKSKT